MSLLKVLPDLRFLYPAAPIAEILCRRVTAVTLIFITTPDRPTLGLPSMMQGFVHIATHMASRAFRPLQGVGRWWGRLTGLRRAVRGLPRPLFGRWTRPHRSEG